MPLEQNVQLPNDIFFQNIVAFIRSVALYRCNGRGSLRSNN